MASNNTVPVILCFHGYGSSGAIYNAQSRRIQNSLRRKFRFVFLDGPYECPPGPGVAPCFEDSGPFYSWFSTGSKLENRALMAANMATLDKTITKSMWGKGISSQDVVGVMGFSQGTMVATWLMMQAQAGNFQWSNLRFGALFCGACAEDLVVPGSVISVPSIHIHGLDDVFLDRSRTLAEMYDPATSKIFEFDGDHRMPTAKSDNDMLATMITKMAKREPKRALF